MKNIPLNIVIKMKNFGLLLGVFLFFSACGSSRLVTKSPKREFRGVWVATVVNIDWPKKSTDAIEKQKEDFIAILSFYKNLNFNAVLVQVRTAGDAFYASEHAPYSRYLTGKEGLATAHNFDILQWMIRTSHEYGMEFHAWLNPYRATFDENLSLLASTHDAITHPDWMIKYGKKYYYNPGLPAVQEHFNFVVSELVNTYDIDGIHFDDYFYPYKIQGESFDDVATYETLKKEGQTIDDWRRSNIDTLVKNTYTTIKHAKPWVQFGVSPFGVWKNIKTDPKGSHTAAGQTTYEDLYADPLVWMKNGWVDYLAPQLYWSMNLPVASHKVLADWWNDNNYNTPIIIGNGAYKIRNNADTAWDKKKELPFQLSYARQKKNIEGNILFSAKSLMNANADVVALLKNKMYKKVVHTPRKNNDYSHPNAPNKSEIIRTATGIRIQPKKAAQIRFVIIKEPKAKGQKTTRLGVAENGNIHIPILNKKQVIRISYIDVFGKESAIFHYQIKP